VHLVVVGIGAAQGIVPADYGKPAPERSGPELLPRGVPHEQMSSKSGRYAGFEGVIHKAGRGSSDRAVSEGIPSGDGLAHGSAGPQGVW
jgi:hypothetical protein